MPITAKFSNGFIDTYKGKRDVRAAWMITNRETGKVLMSGHSLDAARAQQTAEGNLGQYCLAARVGYQTMHRQPALALCAHHVVNRTEGVGGEYPWDAVR